MTLKYIVGDVIKIKKSYQALYNYKNEWYVIIAVDIVYPNSYVVLDDTMDNGVAVVMTQMIDQRFKWS